MAFDAGMVAAIVNELNNCIINAKIEKVQQPEKDEIVLLLHHERENYRLLISAGANNPRMNLTETLQENPKVAPMFCMLLRKHLTGARISAVQQLGFERAVEIEIDAYDDLGFECKKYLICEIMGKYSNIIFCNAEHKVINAIKIVDFTTSQKRQVLPGMVYELPPAQNKRSPLDETEDNFNHNRPITAEYIGISSLVAREIEARSKSMWENFSYVMDVIKNKKFTPVLISDLDGRPLEYSFIPITQYGNSAKVTVMESFGALIDEFFASRDRTDRIKQRAADIFKLLSNAENRLLKKTALQQTDLKNCAEKEKFKLYGDLITSNMYKIERGMTKASLVNYYSEDLEEVIVPLDSRLTPSQNAQRYYKRYNKSKTAEIELTKQLALSKAELDYIYSVLDSLSHAETENDLNEIRHELYESGYASRMKDYNYTAKKLSSAKPLEFRTDGGFKLLCGKNNYQNDYISMKLASKNDIWFHIKNQAGSHVVMLCDGEEPSETDYTQAAMIAAYYSKSSDGVSVPVDYTLVRNLKKPNGSKPGFVIYHTNWSAYVTPDENLVKRLKTSK